MKIIIYLASHDREAVPNRERLLDARSNILGFENVSSTNIEVRDNKLVHGVDDHTNPFDHIKIADRESVQVELIGHGSPHIHNEILSLRQNAYKDSFLSTAFDPKKETPKYPFSIVTPEMLINFFDLYAKDNSTNQYKFSKLTLFACARVDFAMILSKKMPNILITAHKEKITIDKEGDARLINGKISEGEVFLNGKLIIDNEQSLDAKPTNKLLTMPASQSGQSTFSSSSSSSTHLQYSHSTLQRVEKNEPPESVSTNESTQPNPIRRNHP